MQYTIVDIIALHFKLNVTDKGCVRKTENWKKSNLILNWNKKPNWKNQTKPNRNWLVRFQRGSSLIHLLLTSHTSNWLLTFSWICGRNRHTEIEWFNNCSSYTTSKTVSEIHIIITTFGSSSHTQFHRFTNTCTKPASLYLNEHAFSTNNCVADQLNKKIRTKLPVAL